MLQWKSNHPCYVHKLYAVVDWQSAVKDAVTVDVDVLNAVLVDTYNEKSKARAGIDPDKSPTPNSDAYSKPLFSESSWRLWRSESMVCTGVFSSTLNQNFGALNQFFFLMNWAIQMERKVWNSLYTFWQNEERKARGTSCHCPSLILLQFGHHDVVVNKQPVYYRTLCK